MDLHEKVAELSKLPSNSRCIDCNDPNPNWVSLNFGCFICLNCAGFHRSLGKPFFFKIDLMDVD